jgi:hypothetical protein
MFFFFKLVVSCWKYVDDVGVEDMAMEIKTN